MRIGPEPLEQLVTRIFEAAGCPPGEAACVARHLVSANLCGHDSHGVIRVAEYVSGLKDGTIHMGQQITTTFESETVAVIDGHMGFGQSIGEQAMVLLAKKARRSGLGLIALGNTYHVGRGGDWAEQLAEEGLISIHFVSTTGRGLASLWPAPFGVGGPVVALFLAGCRKSRGYCPVILWGNITERGLTSLYGFSEQGLKIKLEKSYITPRRFVAGLGYSASKYLLMIMIA